MWTNPNLNNVTQAANLFFSDKLKEEGIDLCLGFETIEEEIAFEEIALQYLMATTPHETQGGSTRHVPAHLDDNRYVLQYTKANHEQLVSNSYLVVLLNDAIVHTCVFYLNHPLHKLSFLLDGVIETTSRTSYSQYMTQPQSNGYQFMSGYGQGYSQPTPQYARRHTAPSTVELRKEDVERFISFEKTSEQYIAGLDDDNVLVILGISGLSEKFVKPEAGSITQAYSVFIKGCKDHETIKNIHQGNDEFRTVMNGSYNLSGYREVSFHRFTF